MKVKLPHHLVFRRYKLENIRIRSSNDVRGFLEKFEPSLVDIFPEWIGEKREDLDNNSVKGLLKMEQYEQIEILLNTIKDQGEDLNTKLK